MNILNFRIFPILALSLVPALAWGQNPVPPQNPPKAQPGTINYVEGDVSIGTEKLSQNSVGSAVLQAGQTLTTENGRVEILLTPGVFFRVDHNSAVTMISPGLANTGLRLDKGMALVEVADIHKQNSIRIDEDGSNTKLLNKGLYEFDANQQEVLTFKGKAEVYVGNRKTDIGDHHELAINTTSKLKTRSFDTRQYADTSFYRWSGLRSGYLSEANVNAAGLYVNGGPGWYGPGWYWDPDFDSFTFIPGGGIFYSPFGWGFYSPFAAYGSPFFYGGFYGHPHRFGDFHPPYGHGFEPRGGFHGMGGGFRGGFHGAPGGGFHGGGPR